MKTTTEIRKILLAPWTLHFDRDGTEEVAILCDADGEELVTSRPFWLPEDGDPVPPTLAAMRLMVSAPKMLEVMKLALTALNTAPRFRVGETSSYAIASEIERTLRDATDGDQSTGASAIDVQALLVERRMIAVSWGIEDVQEIRPDLDDDQAWEVLQAIEDRHDCNSGITWDTLEYMADRLYPISDTE